jgi:hypothetical protein
MMMRRIGIAVSLMAVVFALASTTAVSSALAVNGPTWGAAEWTEACEEKFFGLYETQAECMIHVGVLFPVFKGWDRVFGVAHTLTALTSREVSIANAPEEPTPQKFLDGLASVECSAVAGSGTIEGGEPGTGSATLKYTGCKVLVKETSEEAKGCSVRSKGAAEGTIQAPVKAKLVYIGTKAQAEKEEGPVGVLYAPSSGSVYAALEFLGTCPTGVGGSHNLEGDVVSEAPTGVQQWSDETFPASAITHYFSWEGGKIVESSVTRLKVFILTVTDTGRVGMSITSMLEGLEASPK